MSCLLHIRNVVFVWCCLVIVCVCVVITLAACTGDAAQSYVVKCRVLGWKEGAVDT